jgi:acyl-[acyl-carrier-protein]-phospholipid O-acyltransferase/long-chain-fatty-acid--[acyl-carrier-protein] ligase
MVQRIIRFILCKLHRAELYGFEKINLKQRAMFMPNHVSLLDAVFLYAVLPRETVFVVNTYIAEKYKFLLKLVNYITVDQMNPFSVRVMIKAVEAGKPLVIFPEGRITVTGGLMKMYSSASFIAMRTQAHVYPVFIKGLMQSKFSYLSKKNRTKWFPKVSVTVGDEIQFVNNPNLSRKVMKEKLAGQTLRLFQQQGYAVEHKDSVNLYNELLEAGKQYGFKHVAIEDFTSANSLKDIVIKSSVLGATLDGLLKPTARVGVMLPTTPTFAILLFGLFKLDRSPALLNFSMGASTIVDCCTNAGIEQVLTSRAFIQKGMIKSRRLKRRLRSYIWKICARESG